MRIIIIDTYYQRYLDHFYSSRENTIGDYNSTIKQLLESNFGTSDYYSYHLRQLGHEAWDIVANDPITQKKWANENSVSYFDSPLYDRLSSLPYAYRFIGRSPWIQQIVLAQVKSYHPDIVYVHDLSVLTPTTMHKIKTSGAMLVGQIACPLPAHSQLTQFDLILTSFPHYVDYFRKHGISSEYFRIGFDERLPEIIGKHKRIYDVSFVGSFSPHHSTGTKILELLSKSVSLNVWGQGLSKKSPLYRHYHGEAWGKEMYRILASSKIVINRHIGAAKYYANNMRLYEATGMGALLITDVKKNLKDLFHIGSEVIAYSSPSELIMKVKHYLKNEDERQKVARAGQKRTMLEHSYKDRMKELLIIINKYHDKKR